MSFHKISKINLSIRNNSSELKKNDEINLFKIKLRKAERNTTLINRTSQKNSLKIYWKLSTKCDHYVKPRKTSLLIEKLKFVS